MEHNITYDVFISFSFADQATVDRIVNLLTNVYNISCWICTEEIRAGENFRKDLAMAINSAGLVVLVQSKHSAVSKEVSKEPSKETSNEPVVVVPENTNPQEEILSYQDALQLVLKKMPQIQPEMIEMELDKENGQYIYEGDFHYDSHEYEFEINAKTGNFLKCF